jgi:hypothetical protein
VSPTGETDHAATAPADRSDPEPSRDSEDIAERIAEALNPSAGPASAASNPSSVIAPGAAPPADASHDTIDPAESPAAKGPDDNGDIAEQNAADTHPVPGPDTGTSPGGDDAVADPPGSSAPIILRILGRPTLLVEARSAVHRQPLSAGAAGDAVDSPGVVEVTAVEVAATLSARMRDLLVYLAVHHPRRGTRRVLALMLTGDDAGARTVGQRILQGRTRWTDQPRRRPAPRHLATRRDNDNPVHEHSTLAGTGPAELTAQRPGPPAIREAD